MSTKEELQAENERLGAEVAALRVLLGAVSDLADVPLPADSADVAHFYECARRVDLIAVYAGGDIGAVRPEIRAAVLHDRAQALREHGRRALRYKARAAEPAPGPANPPHDVTELLGEDSCRAEDSGYICNARAAHDGPDHVAYGDGQECHRWPVTAEPEPAKDEPCSPDAANALYDAIAAGTPVVVSE